ncbi:MAG: hypothetical protein ACD_39C00968G0002 [uncultured bacterium]|nr:MAG: hypothetical protein ACD_39C00968G0002 [uncultured bacterium]
MRKVSLILIFQLFCILLAGCGGGGGGGGVGVPMTPAENVVFEAQIPSTALNANLVANMTPSLRAALVAEDIEISLAGVPLKFISVSGDSLIYRLEFSAENNALADIIEQGGGLAELMIAVGTKEAVTQQLELNTRTAGESTKKLTITIRITNQIRNGIYGVEIIGGPGVGPIGAPGQSGKSLGITDIEYRAVTDEYLPLYNATEVPVDGTEIRIKFDAPVEHATNSFRITADNESGSLLAISQEDLGTAISAEVTNVAETETYPAYSYLTFIFLKSSAATKALLPATEYTVKFELQTVRRVDDPMVKLRPFVILKRTFTTASK